MPMLPEQVDYLFPTHPALEDYGDGSMENLTKGKLQSTHLVSFTKVHLFLSFLSSGAKNKLIFTTVLGYQFVFTENLLLILCPGILTKCCCIQRTMSTSRLMLIFLSSSGNYLRRFELQCRYTTFSVLLLWLIWGRGCIGLEIELF